MLRWFEATAWPSHNCQRSAICSQPSALTVTRSPVSTSTVVVSAYRVTVNALGWLDIALR